MDDSNIHIEIEEKDNNILVHVEVNERREYPLVPLIVIETKNIVSYLEEKNIKFGDLIDRGSSNNRRNHNRKGTWIFQKKTLDKSPKKVIIKEEKSVQPKFKPSSAPKKKRTRSSIKKVSKEV